MSEEGLEKKIMWEGRCFSLRAVSDTLDEPVADSRHA
jgi:hypothetical protein